MMMSSLLFFWFAVHWFNLSTQMGDKKNMLGWYTKAKRHRKSITSQKEHRCDAGDPPRVCESHTLELHESHSSILQHGLRIAPPYRPHRSLCAPDSIISQHFRRFCSYHQDRRFKNTYVHKAGDLKFLSNDIANGLLFCKRQNSFRLDPGQPSRLYL
jgi:hypothetical protein